MSNENDKHHHKAPKINVETGQIDVSGIEEEAERSAVESLEDRIAPSVILPGGGDAIEGAEEFENPDDPTAGDPEPGDDFTGDPEPGDDFTGDPPPDPTDPPPDDPFAPPDDPINNP